MELPLPILWLAGATWVIVFAGLLLFATMAISARKQNRDQEQIIGTLRNHVQRLTQQEPEEEAVEEQPEEQPEEEQVPEQEPATVSQAEFDELESELIDAREEVARQSESYEALRGEHNQIKAEHKQLSESVEALTRDKAALEQQVESLSESLAMGEESMMKEMIISFTEESRELLATIHTLETEIAELQQFIEDSQSSEQGTTGTVVGLKRKLEEAEEAFNELQREYLELKAQSRADAATS